MAMRPTRGGISGIRAATAARPVFRRPVFEDFRPLSEWKHVEGADVLLVHLPGFVKENLKITSEPGNMIKVRGERMLANNTWSRFSQDFRIPEYCSVGGISARFEAGVLYITMSINSTPTSPKVATNNETQNPDKSTETEKSLEEKTAERGFESKTVEKVVMEPKPESDAKTKLQKSAEDVKTSAAKSSAQKAEQDRTNPENTTTFRQKTTNLVEDVKSKLQKSVEDYKASVAKSSAQKAEQDQTNPENTTTFKQKTTNLVEDAKSKLQKSVEDYKANAAKSSAQKAEQDQTNPENTTTYKQKTTNLVEEAKSKLQKSAEDVNTGAVKSSTQKIEQDQTETINKEKEGSNSREKEEAKEYITQTREKGEDQLEKYKKVVTDFATKVKDDRESVMNIGVAVLVLVSLWVYISYTTFRNV